MKKTWYITGASKGLGLALVRKLLAEGYNVAATSRNIVQLKNAIGDGYANQFLPLEVDLTNEDSVKKSIEQTRQHFNALDVIVNNAGYGIGGAVEELSDKEIKDSFDVNVFATINVIKFAMPFLRKQRSGHIINISSIAGFAAATGWAVYSAVKHAVIGLSEIMAEDVKEFGVKVTVVAPGAFRTDFLTADSLVLAENKIDDYTVVRASHQRYGQMDGQQIGDPDKAADVFIALAESENPPVRLYLGNDAYQRAKAKIEILGNELEANKALGSATDFS